MNSSPHILLYTDDPDEGGVAQYNHSLLLDLRQRGYRVSCVQSYSENPLVRRRAEAGVRHIWLGYHTIRNFGQTLSDVSGPEGIYRDVRPDMILFSDNCPPSLFAAKAAAVRAGIPFLIVEGFVAPYLADRFHSYLTDIAHHYEKSRQVIAVSQDNLNLLRTRFGLPSDKGRVIHYGRPARYFEPPDPSVRSRLRRELGIPDESVLCFTAARLEPVKGYHHQLAAIERLRASSIWPLLYFAWAGPGSQRAEIEQQIQRSGLEAHVKLLGQRWDVAEWLDAADIFALPSDAEGMPLAVREAMAKGLPVIASGVSGIPEELGETGCLLPPPVDNRELNWPRRPVHY